MAVTEAAMRREHLEALVIMGSFTAVWVFTLIFS